MVYILVVGMTDALPAACSFSARLSHSSTMLAPSALLVLAQAFITAEMGTVVGSSSPTGMSCNLRFMRNNHSRFLERGERLLRLLLVVLVAVLA